MWKLKAIILFLFVLVTQAVAQDTLHLCVGESHDFAVPYVNGSDYDWKLQNTAIATISSGNGTEHIIINLISSGVFQLIVEELKPNGCFGYDSILVEIHDKPNPIISALGPVIICEGIDVILQVNTIYDSYCWSDGSLLSELLVDTTGDYSVIVTDKFGCVNQSNSILIDVQSDFSAEFYFEGICVNNPTTFFNTSSSSSLGSMINSLSWDFGNGIQSNNETVSLSYNLVGDYDVSLFVETDIGCYDSIIKTVSILGNPEANFMYNPFTVSTLDPEFTFTNTSITGLPFLWEFGDSSSSTIESPLHTYENPGIYDVLLIVEDLNDCMDSTIQQVIVYYEFVLYLPSAFTPNNDGDNDAFCPKGLRMEKYKSYELSIYNQWGDRIFETNDINECWDGANCPSDVYNWLIIITDELGKLRKQNGLVTLIK